MKVCTKVVWMVVHLAEMMVAEWVVWKVVPLALMKVEERVAKMVDLKEDSLGY